MNEKKKQQQNKNKIKDDEFITNSIQTQYKFNTIHCEPNQWPSTSFKEEKKTTSNVSIHDALK